MKKKLKKKLKMMCMESCIMGALLFNGCGQETKNDGDTLKSRASLESGEVVAGEQKTEDERTEEEIKLERRNFMEVYQLYQNVLAEFEIGDIDLGEVNHNCRTIQKYDTNEPLFVIYVNPMADASIIEKYVNSAMAVDRYLADNREYAEYSKENGAPYFITFKCHERDIYKMMLDGNNEKEKVMEGVEKETQTIRDDLLLQLKSFRAFLDNYDGIGHDENGGYYFVLDSLHYTESFEEIYEHLMEINQYNPISYVEGSGYEDSYKLLGYPDGSFSIYVDQYAGEKIEEFQFSEGKGHLFWITYSYFVDTNKGYGNNELVSYNPLAGRINENGVLQINVTVKGLVGYEEMLASSYECYQYLYSEYEEHGIRMWDEMLFCGEFRSAQTKGYSVYLKAGIPIDDFLSGEEFETYYLAGWGEFDPSIYELDDDCD